MTDEIKHRTISAGVARADITPPVGIKSVGFSARGPLTRLHDPLYATALVAADGERRAALLACDLLGLDDETVADVRAEVHHRTGIAPGDVTVTCTHTHYGPDAFRFRGDPMVDAYRANLVHVLGGVVEEAAAGMGSALLGVGWGQSYIGVNRREKLPDGRVILGQNPAGPIDRTVGVLRIDAPDGTPLACVVNFQTHPVSQASQVDHISADYPGKMRDLVEMLTGAKCLFLQGASGNINAVIMEPCYEPARTLGTRLGCEVVRVWETVTPGPVSGLEVAGTTVELPRIRYGSAEKAEEVAQTLESGLERLRAENAPEGRVDRYERRLGWARDAARSWQTGELPEPVQAELQAWRIGSFAFATAPGEIFNQIGSRVKGGSPFQDTFFVTLANGYIGYVPVPEAYPDGGYEVMQASQVDPEAAATLAEGCLGLLRQLHVGSKPDASTAHTD
jgi:neutral ceramidase